MEDSSPELELCPKSAICCMSSLAQGGTAIGSGCVILRSGSRIARARARIHLNVKLGIGLNSFYLLGALSGCLGPALTAILHNLTSISIALGAIRPYSISKKADPAQEEIWAQAVALSA